MSGIAGLSGWALVGVLLTPWTTADWAAKLVVQPPRRNAEPSLACGARLTVAARVALKVPRSPDNVDPVALALNAAGGIAVFDGGIRAVRLFDQAGKPIGRIDGPGPLKLSLVVGMAIAPSGAHVLWDAAKQQLVIIEGGKTSFVPLLGRPVPGMPAKIQAAGSGVALGIRRPAAGGNGLEDVIHMVDLRTGSQRTVGPFLVRSARVFSTASTTSVVNLADDLADRFVWGLGSSERTVGGWSHGTSLVDAERPTELRASVGPLVVPISKPDIDNALAMAGTTGVDSAGLRAMLPKTKAEIVELTVGDEWAFVRRPTPDPHLYRTRYTIFETKGWTDCGLVELDGRLLDSRGALVAGLQYHPNGAIDAIIYRVGRLR